MKCHFVYAVPFDTGHSLRLRAMRKLRRLRNRIGFGLLSHRTFKETDFLTWPIRSPYENTRHYYTAFSKAVPTLLYDIYEKVTCNFEPDDVFVGHPFFPHVDGGFGVTELSLMQKARPRKAALITPLHCDVTVDTYHINKQFLDDVDKLMPYVDVLFGIMGEYWWDRWDSSPYSHWKSKMVRVDMAIEAARFPFIKRRFNKPGERGFLFVGSSDDARKGISIFKELTSKVKGGRKGWIGSGPDISGIERISDFRSLTPEFMTDVAKHYDFFVSTAIADPNPTTILESMAWGFPVLCTPQSGYYESKYLKNIFLEDLDKSAEILDSLQFASESHLRHVAAEARQAVESHYAWRRVTSEVVSSVFC